MSPLVAGSYICTADYTINVTLSGLEKHSAVSLFSRETMDNIRYIVLFSSKIVEPICSVTPVS